CFWNCGTAAGAVLKIRQGVFPAVIDAPMTSSELLPAGISSAVPCSSGWAWFQAATTALPHFTSSSLLEYQILIGPLAWAALSADWPPPPPPPPPPPQPTRARPRVATTAIQSRMRVLGIGDLLGRGRGRGRLTPGGVGRWMLGRRGWRVEARRRERGGPR